MQALGKLLRFFNTIKYLKPSQIYGRIWFHLYRPTPVLSKEPERRKPEEWIAPILKSQSFVSDNKFNFLNHIGKLNSSEDWNNPKYDKLWLYNLHYFDYIQSKNADEESSNYHNLINRWIIENQPGQGNGWEPYPLSLRLVNWIKWLMSGNYPPDMMLHSMAVQARYLGKRCEHHLLGNHLFVNGKALLFAGLFFKGKEADEWFAKGQKIINCEIAEQILEDGGNFERSPMYHAIFLEDILDIINLLKTFNHPVSNELSELVVPMFVWLEAMSHPDGEVSFFNDSAIGISSSYRQLKAYAVRLEVKVKDEGPGRLSVFKDSGYIRVNNDNLAAILDLAPVGPDYIPGHAHADSLSFELSLYGRRCFVNSGTSLYGASSERVRQRGTAAHNTLVVDGENSSEVWGGFRVARRAYIVGVSVEETENEISIYGEHTGYTRLSGSPVHKRKWQFFSDKLIITDQIASKQSHRAAVYFHFHPDWDVFLKDETVFIKQSNHIVRLVIEGQGTVELFDSSYHPEFGISVPNKKIVYHRQEKCSGIIKTTISW